MGRRRRWIDCLSDMGDNLVEFAAECTRCLRGVNATQLLIHANAVVRAKGNPLPLYQLAEVCRYHGRLDLWRRGVDLALQYPHISCEHRFHRASMKGLMGDWSAWTDFEARVFQPDSGMSTDAWSWRNRLWDGREDVSKKTVLVRDEGDFGESICMLRLVPRLLSRVGRIIIIQPPELVEFARYNSGQMVDVVPVDDATSVKADRYIWRLSLPYVTGGLPPFAPLTAPAPIPYLDREDETLHLGLCWACSDKAPDYKERSIPLDALTKLFTLPNITWHVLQVGPNAADANDYPVLCPPTVPLRTFADTANCVAALDGVITCDTAVADLAGSLGVLTFVLLRHYADWRWGLDDRTPWYPSLRLVRQSAPGEWNSVISDTRMRIAELTANRMP